MPPEEGQAAAKKWCPQAAPTMQSTRSSTLHFIRVTEGPTEPTEVSGLQNPLLPDS